MIKFYTLCAALLFTFETSAAQVFDQDIPFSSESNLDLVIFGSPYDLQFLEALDAVKAFNKKYKPFGFNVTSVAKKEPPFPFESESSIRNDVPDSLTLIDANNAISKKWRAFVSPSIFLRLKNGKIVNLENGTFDAFSVEKNIQKYLKEAGQNNLPQKEFSNELEYKNCPQSLTHFFGNKQLSRKSSELLKVDNNWSLNDYFIEYAPKVPNEEAKIEIHWRGATLGVIAQTNTPGASVLKFKVDEKSEVPSNIKNIKMYELFSQNTSHSMDHKTVLSTKSKGLRIWAIQTLPYCRTFK